jgi:signal transduction histidine kinase
MAIYRIAQEALNNVAKHSGASQVKVILNCDSDSVELTVSDNGKGFKVNSSQADSLGLGIMRERAREIGALLDIKSKIGRGTQVKVNWEKRAKEKK